MRVAFVLRSAEVQPFVPGFVQIFGPNKWIIEGSWIYCLSSPVPNIISRNQTKQPPPYKKKYKTFMLLYGMVWYGMVWYGMVWYGMVCYTIRTTLCKTNTQKFNNQPVFFSFQKSGLHLDKGGVRSCSLRTDIHHPTKGSSLILQPSKWKRWDIGTTTRRRRRNDEPASSCRSSWQVLRTHPTLSDIGYLCGYSLVAYHHVNRMFDRWEEIDGNLSNGKNIRSGRCMTVSPNKKTNSNISITSIMTRISQWQSRRPWSVRQRQHARHTQDRFQRVRWR